MTKLLLEFGADPDGGIWPKREATSPYIMARDRGYEEIVDVHRRGSREAWRTRPQRSDGGHAQSSIRRFSPAAKRRSWPSSIEHPELAEMCPPDGLTMLHKMAGLGALQRMKWLLDRWRGREPEVAARLDAARLCRDRPGRRLALRQWEVRTRRSTSPGARRSTQPALRRNPGPLGLSGETFQAGAGRQQACWKRPSRATTPRSCAACSTSVSILTNARRSATSPSRPGRPAARCFRPWS